MRQAAESPARVWARGAAIRPVPGYAVVGEKALRSIEAELADDGEDGAEAASLTAMDRAFARFEESQPEVSARVQEILDRPLDEVALALGYFLSIAVWLAFDASFGARVQAVTRDAWGATVDALALEEDLRRENAAEPLDLDDLLALEQPELLAFVHDHIDAALETGGLSSDDATSPAGAPDLGDAAEGGDGPRVREVDVDDVHLVYRTILLETLALSHAVVPGPDEASPELLA